MTQLAPFIFVGILIVWAGVAGYLLGRWKGYEQRILQYQLDRLLEAIDRAGFTMIPLESPDFYENDWEVPLEIVKR